MAQTFAGCAIFVLTRVIQICRGDLFESENFKSRPYLLVHGCNDVGKFGAGFAMEVKRRLPAAYDYYLRWFKSPSLGSHDRTRLQLGAVQLVPVVGTESYVGNAITQHGVASYRMLKLGARPPFRPTAFLQCMTSICDLAPKLAAKVSRPEDFKIIMPQIGCGLAGSTWDQVEPLLRQAAAKCATPIVVYVR